MELEDRNLPRSFITSVGAIVIRGRIRAYHAGIRHGIWHGVGYAHRSSLR